MVAEVSAAEESSSGPSWRRGFEDLDDEHGFVPLEVDGALPDGLVGTLYRNGPALRGSFGTPYGHWFDGDGAVSAVHFAGGAAAGAARVTASAGLREERRRGRTLFGGYGTRGPERLPPLFHPFRRKNTANTGLLSWQGRLFALMEAARPTELDPDDLETLGEADLRGVLGRTFTAHPHRVAALATTFAFGVDFGPRPGLRLYALPDFGPAERLGRLRLKANTLVHDFIATRRHLIFFVSPVALRMTDFLLGRRTFGQALAWRPARGTEVIVVPLASPGRPLRFRTEPFWQWHFVNAFERGDRIVVDAVAYPDFQSNGWLEGLVQGQDRATTRGRLTRFVVHPGSRTLAAELLWDAPAEFPAIAPAVAGGGHRYVWLLAHDADHPAALPTRLARVDTETGDVQRAPLDAGRVSGEPVFVPRPGGRPEDAGWLLSLVYDVARHRSGVAVLDAGQLDRGPIATAWLDHHVPYGFHGVWVPG